MRHRVQEALQVTLIGNSLAALAWCGDALFAGIPEEAVAYYRDLAALGFKYFIANILAGDEETVELLGTEVAPAFS